MPEYSLDKWSNEMPTAENAGQWLYVKHEEQGYPPRIRIKEVIDRRENGIWLCGINDMGITKESYGNALSMYLPHYTSFCGPIPMPPGYKKDIVKM